MKTRDWRGDLRDYKDTNFGQSVINKQQIAKQRAEEAVLRQQIKTAREKVRNAELSPYREYRERQGNYGLNINGKPYTGVREEQFNVSDDEFRLQDDLYKRLSKSLNESDPLDKEQHLFNSKYRTKILPGERRPLLQTVNLRGGPDIEYERKKYQKKFREGKFTIDDMPNITLGKYSRAERSLNLNRLDKEQTRKALKKYAKDAEAFDEQYRENHDDNAPPDDVFLEQYGPPILGEGINKNMLHTHKHEGGHVLYENLNRNAQPNIFRNFDFADDNPYLSPEANNFNRKESYKRVGDIINTGLHNYDQDQYPAEVLAHLTGDISKKIPHGKHRKLGQYLNGSVKFFKNLEMNKDFPHLYKRYVELNNQIAHDEDMIQIEPEEPVIFNPQPKNVTNAINSVRPLNEKFNGLYKQMNDISNKTKERINKSDEIKWQQPYIEKIPNPDNPKKMILKNPQTKFVDAKQVRINNRNLPHYRSTLNSHGSLNDMANRINLGNTWQKKI